MTIRQHNLGSIVKPGFNPLGAQTSGVYYGLFSWGSNISGQLGLGDTANRSSPTQIGGLSPWSKVNTGGNFTSGGYFTLATKTDGTLWSWGQNNNGQLGLGNTTYYSSPKQVGTLTNWLNISGGAFHTATIKTNGTLWTWGRNIYGQLGLSNNDSYSSPKQVGLLTTWSKVECGDYFTLATKTDGTLWSWGNNAYGQLGLGNTTDYNSPKQVGALTTWLAIAGGGYHTVATKTDGTIWAWGRNNQGQLGLGNATNYSSPKQVGALTTWSSITAGLRFTVATTTSGTLWSWGSNSLGQLGLNSATYAFSSPSQVGSLSTWSSAAGGGYHAIARKTDGTIWTWGFNADGQLGLGNTTFQFLSPMQVGSLNNWLTIAAGGYFTLALG